MKREIKFRAWDPTQKIMSYFVTIYSEKGKDSEWFGEHRHESGDTICDFNGLPEHLMQYTGLKDKNGKKIYEGDILSNGKAFYDVYYSPCAFWARTFNGSAISDIDFLLENKFIVIGNIYENPELLKN